MIVNSLTILTWLTKTAIGIMAAMWLWEHVLEKKIDNWLSRFEDEE